MSNENSYSLKKLVQGISAQLQSMYPASESRQLAMMALEHVAGIDHQKVLLNDSVAPSATEMEHLNGIVKRLLACEPIQYILGYAHFYGRDFIVNPSVLIPRQETEELVSAIIKANTSDCPAILDIGTGSGCIAVTLALEIPGAEVTALDIDSQALQVAEYNATALGAKLKLSEVDILSIDHIPDTYNIIVSNPPYVTYSEKSLMHHNVLQFEPSKALFVPDEDPLLFYRKICCLAFNSLEPGGLLFFEINERFGREVCEVCSDAGLRRTDLLQDLNGKDRFVRALV